MVIARRRVSSQPSAALAGILFSVQIPAYLVRGPLGSLGNRDFNAVRGRSFRHAVTTLGRWLRGRAKTSGARAAEGRVQLISGRALS